MRNPATAAASAQRPNLVWILTDDQDQVLGGSFPAALGSTPMPKTMQLLQEAGAHATNWHIHTPICSPSRSELLTGRYFHNIKKVGSGSGGMHVNYTKVNPHTFVRRLHDAAGYATGLFGKYLNKMPTSAPPGFDAWLANNGGSYISPSFQTKNIDGLPDGGVRFTNAPENYSTSVIGNISIAWIRKVVKQGRHFMAYIAPKAAHEPFNPAPWYRDHWDPSWPQEEPRPENWNCSMESRRHHHGNIATQPMLTEQSARVITGIFKNRWRTLMSVDDLVADVVHTVEELGVANNTYFFYSSDHGFQLGQFNIPMDKRHVYEWDTKIHLLARGPGIKPGTVLGAPGTQVDIAPTLLGLAGVVVEPDGMDGRSIAPFLLHPSSPELPESVREHLEDIGNLTEYRNGWRNEVFIEFYYCSRNEKCMVGCRQGRYPKEDTSCADLAKNVDCWCPPTEKTSDCYLTEDTANNFIALRTYAGGASELYAEYQTGDEATADVAFENVDFYEYYDVASDPWQLRNLAENVSKAESRKLLHDSLHYWFQCFGQSCP